MSEHGEVLVALIKDKRDFAILQNQNWYRIPVSSVEKWLKERWPPKWIAFYQPKEFGDEAYSVRYYTEVLDIQTVHRSQLFPNEPADKKSNYRYYKMILSTLKTLPEPIFSRRWRRIVFVSTTWQKFINAVEINDLYDESPLEDRLWAEFKRHNIPAERQEFITIKQQNYALDFAIFCENGNIDVETDGDSWHANPEKAAEDNLRDNFLEAAGWKVLRFSTPHIQEQATEYCIPTVTETINNLGGVDEGKYISRKINLKAGAAYQLGLFDNSELDDR